MCKKMKNNPTKNINNCSIDKRPNITHLNYNKKKNYKDLKKTYKTKLTFFFSLKLQSELPKESNFNLIE